ncbi:MAG: glycosyltransferase family 2 protein [Magnetococcales bacterium]|nr:glycosyltransferase family 2 protein [Magnetococcales bacterium]
MSTSRKNEAESPLLSVLVPLLNEAENLRPLHQRLVQTLEEANVSFEIIFVDDGSEDDSLEILRELHAQDARVRYASFSRNFGHEAATTCGFTLVRGQCAVLIDADLQDPPEIIPQLLEAWRGGAMIVHARRRRRAGERLWKLVTAHLFYRILNQLSSVPIPNDVGDFRLVDRRVVDHFNAMPERKRFVRAMIAWVGYTQSTVEYDRAPRVRGKTNYNFIKLLALSLDAITSNSVVPLRLCILLGLMVTGFSFTLALVVVLDRMFFGLNIQGYTLTTAGMFLLGGVQITFLGVIGEYVGKIYTQVQGRPLFILQETEQTRDDPT